MKRSIDIFLSLVGLAFLGLPMLLIGLLVRLESRGPALFRQRRAGWNGRPFDMLKFRSMRTDVDPYGESPQSGEDSRLTRLGRVLRETSLDELPQLINVLCGDMSLVGPRPLYERQAQQWDARQRRRLLTPPGLTGYAQVYGRANLTHEDKIELDLYYVDNRSIGMDLLILLGTVGRLLLPGRGVYERRYSARRERESDRAS